ncbi:PPOX class F420-dependent oxidoreductase [Dactylosporangium aurantiacum]|uniref:PPOX class F420-dependent oxidoreductase n=1 Tax=Dactylosporangium aurantiacum TaxID=35754 RepID=A0A9Q9IAF1_9ACTN|nr:PPOX class F420-dependent oxidoreductase [Dactylosporangium aurantiacum]MDG6101798.1 PPOX class F420-dependent oxidoreductase [Dactylosporangium aurantiacum]UWZ52397.1 PPOX class F420-dependent oxidoreductase [Dactylosporangium aurantiacum]
MSFTAKEVQYLRSQQLGRLATVGADGTPHNVPVGYRYNADLGTIDITGRDLRRSRKYRDVQAGSRVAFIVDDLPSTAPIVARGLEVRGTAEALTGDEDLIRVRPVRIVTWGIEADWQAGPTGRTVRPATPRSAT